MCKALILMLFVLVPIFLSAQQTNVGGITGTVRDPTGAMVAGAKVTAVNQGTSLKQEDTTNSNGEYSFTLLPIGTYTLTVTQEGFQTAERTDVPVISGKSFTTDFQLVLGKASETVTVTGAAPTVDTTTVNTGTTRTLQELATLPVGIAGSGSREAAGFVKTVAGVAQVGYGPDWMQLSRGAINGTPGVFFGYQIDGVDASTGESETGEDFIAPTPDVVNEVRITQNTDTSVGFNGGVAYALTFKSGTNNIHGSGYYYGENEKLNSRNFFGANRDRARENEPGFTLGGPVYIPHVYDGRNKTFFFTSIDVYRESNIATQIATVPTALMRNGDFSEILGPASTTPDALGRTVYQNEIYDPSTTRNVTAGQVDPVSGLVAASSGPVRDPFMYGGKLNVINPAQFSSVSSYFQQGYLPANQPGVFNNWLGNAVPPSDTFKDQWLLKVDQIAGDKHRFTFALEKNVPWFLGSAKGVTAGLSGHSSSQNSSGFLLPLLSSTFVDDRDSYRLRFNWVWSMTPNVLFNFGAGMTRDPNRRQEQFPLDGPEYTGSAMAGLTGTLNPMTPWTTIDGYGNVDGFGPRFGPGQLIDSQRNVFRVSWTWSKSSHTIRIGSDFELLPYIYHDNTQSQGVAGFSHSDTALPSYSATGTGWGWASFLLGAVNSMQVASPTANKFTSGGFALYAQDTWRATQKLTINYGLRWDLYMPGHEQYNRISSFSPSVPNPGANDILGGLTFWGTGPGRNGRSNITSYYFKAFAPRIGFAYAFNPRTVLRASAGLSYYPFWTKYIGSGGMLIQQTGFISLVNVNESATSGLFPAFYWDNGFPGVYPPLPNLDPAQQNHQSPQYLDPVQNRPSMGENLNIEVERELPKQFVLRVDYVGTLAHRLPLSGWNFNVLPLQDISLGNKLFLNINDPAAAGIPKPYPSFSGTVAQALEPYPQYSGLSTLSDQWGNSAYHAAQISVQKHFGSLTMLANYTISKWLTNGNYVGFLGYGGSNSFQHPDFRMPESKQLSSLDRPQVLNLSWVYELPVGKGKRFLSGAGPVTDRILGGWRVSAIQTYYSGTPLSISGNQSIPGVGGVWVNRVPNVPVTLQSCGDLNPSGSNNRLLNVNAFTEPAPFQFGNSSQQPNVRGCGYKSEDVSFDKGITLTESTRFHLGLIVANMFNRHYWTGINTSLPSPGFGTISGATSPRTMQYYVRFEF
jgi:hypothetical protein